VDTTIFENAPLKIDTTRRYKSIQINQLH
jgi:hypothetical protein